MIKRLSVAILAGLVLWGCADKKDDDYSGFDQRGLDLWMKANRPDLTKGENGMYVEKLMDGTGQSPVSGEDWVAMNYTVRDLEGRLVASNVESTVDADGKATRVAHYVPVFAKYDTSSWTFSAGEFVALGGMKSGESARIYMPATYGHRTNESFSEGFMGWWYGGGNPSVSISGRAQVVELEIVEVTDDPKAREEAMVYNARGTMTAVSDTIPGLYFEVIQDNGGDVLPVDSIAYVDYALRFLDGKLVATNDAEVAWNDWGKFGKLYNGPEAFVGSASSPVAGTALNVAVKHGRVKYNSVVRFMFTSGFGYGSSGLAATAGSSTAKPAPAVYPYTPLTLEVAVMPEDFEP